MAWRSGRTLGKCRTTNGEVDPSSPWQKSFWRKLSTNSKGATDARKLPKALMPQAVRPNLFGPNLFGVLRRGDEQNLHQL